MSLVLFWIFCGIARGNMHHYDELESDMDSTSAEFGDDDLQENF